MNPRALLAAVLFVAAGTLALADEPKKPVTILVAARDLPIGTRVTSDDLTQLQIPAELYTESVVKPDAVSYLVDQQLAAPVLRGDWIRWQFFEAAVGTKTSRNKCLSARKTQPSAAQEVAQLRQESLGATP